MPSIQWRGVFPAATTQFAADLSIDIEATRRVVDNLVKDGVHGLIAMGTVGENNSLLAAEKRQVLEAIVDVVAGRVPVLTGVSELTTPLAETYARDAAKIGADGAMLLPAMVYVPSEAEHRQLVRRRPINGDPQLVCIFFDSTGTRSSLTTGVQWMPWMVLL